MNKSLKILSFVLFILSCQVLRAQVFPVQVTTQLTPPYSLYLSDYVTPGSERLALNIFLGDIARPELQVKLRLRIINQAQNIIIETRPEYNPPPISIQGGVPLRLISTDIADYFNPNNLNFQGITKRQYEQQGKLPEGVYQFCFEVLEYNRGIKISNTGCGTAWMILNDPPLINVPRQNEKLKTSSPQNVVLQWTPRHTGSPNSAFTTEYEVRIVEIWPATRNPNDAILTSPAIFESTTQSTTLIYGPAETPLEPGRKYAFRVRAKSIVGVEELDLFKNQGYSETYTFTYGDACDLPTGISAQATSNRMTLKWDGKFNHTAYNVRYRQAGTTQWYTNNSTFNEASLTSLKPATVYEYQVSGMCGWFESDYTPVAAMKTNDEPPRTYSCGLPLETFNLDPSKLTGSLKVGDVVNAGDFDVELTKVTGASGTFSGEGVVVMPMMNKIKVKAEFTNITVASVPTATDYRMVKGFMNITGAAAEVIPANVLATMDKLTETLDKVDKVVDTLATFIPKKGPDPISFAADTLVRADDKILAVVKNPTNGKITITSTSGKVKELEPGKNYAITDKDGKGYLVDSKGGVTKTTAENAVKASKRTYNLQLHFAKAPNTIHGFDEKNIDALAYTYEKLGKDYYVPWKSVDATKPDYATAMISDKTIDAGKITFVKEIVDANITSSSGTAWNVNLNNITPGVTGTITAMYPAQDTTKKDQVLGKLNVIGYNNESYNVVVVPVNNGINPFTSEAELSGMLKKIYDPAVVEWNVRFENKITVDVGSPFDAGASDMLSNYTGDMKKVINAYGKHDDKNYYLFLIEKTANITYEGYMPRSKQAGFLFVTSGTSKESFVHTAAHELGHGAFALKHTFSELTALKEGTTTNLMDYYVAGQTPGNDLLKFQWDRVHDPVTVIGLFEDDADAKSVIATLGNKLSVKGEGKYNAFLTPGGQRIILSTDQYPIFFHGIENDTYNNIVPGALIGFRDKPSNGQSVFSGKLHMADLSGGTFNGYRDYKYEKPVIKDDDNSIVIGLPSAKEGKNYAIYKFDGSSAKDFSNQSTPIMSVLSEEFERLSFFGSNKYDEKSVSYRDAAGLLGEEQIQISNFELEIIKGKYIDIKQLLGFTTLLQGFTNISHEEKPEIFLIIKLAEYNNRYPVYFQEHSSWFDMWNVLAALKKFTSRAGIVYPKEVVDKIFQTYSGSGDWDNQNVTTETISNTSSTYAKWNNNLSLHNAQLYDFYRQFILKLQTYSSGAAKANIECLKNLTTKNSSKEIYDCIVRASEDELTKDGILSDDNRIYAIKSLLNQFWVDGKSEEAIVRLIRFIPSSFNSDDFLDKLENECAVTIRSYSVDPYALGAQATYEETVCLWEVLFTRVNNSKFLFSGDNRKQLMLALLKHYYRSNKFKTQMAEYKKSQDAFELDDIEAKRYAYEYQGIFRRLWSDTKQMYSPYFVSPADYYVSLNTTISSTGTGKPTKIKVDQQNKKGFSFSRTQYSQELSPFSLTMFTNKSNQDLLRDFSQKDAIPVPAIILHYASEVGDEETASQLIQTGIDVGTLVIPGAQLASLSKLGKVLYYADKISSVASIGGTAFKTENPEVAKIFSMASLATGVASLGSIAAGSKLSSITKAEKLLDATPAQIIKNTTDLADEIIKFKGTETLYELTSKQADGLRQILAKDKQVLSEMGHLNDVQKLKLDNAIEALDAVKVGSSAWDFTKTFRSVTSDFNGFSKAIGTDNFIDVIIHSKNGKFIALVEENGILIEKAIDEVTFAKFLDDLPQGQIRLLSCNDLEQAKLLSKNMNRPLVASDGWVDLYADGTITSEKAFVKLDKGAKSGEDLIKASSTSVGTPLRLGEELAKGAGSVWKWLPDGSIKSVDDLVLGTGNTIKYNATKFTELTVELQVKLLTENVSGLTKEQAEFIINFIKTRNGRAVFGGSRVRGNAKITNDWSTSSDLDLGFDGLSSGQRNSLINDFNKKFAGSSQNKIIEHNWIYPNSTPSNIPTILSPEEFFMRSGVRSSYEGGLDFGPSGFISIDFNGNVILGK